MPDPTAPRLNKWPFLLGDGLLAATAVIIYSQANRPLGTLELCLVVSCVAFGAALSLLPFVLEYRTTSKMAEAAALTNVVSQVSQMESVAAQIATATGRWSAVQEEAEKVSAAAKTISDRMTAELKSFTEFMQRANDSEKTSLRLEVEKARRGESDWLQVLMRVLDHVYAIYSGAVKSGQPNLVEQLSHFQNACRDAARRVGMVPFVAAPAEPFDPKRHQVGEGNGTPPEGATVASTVATGYTFQGRLLRPALVLLNDSTTLAAEPVKTPASAPRPSGQAELL